MVKKIFIPFEKHFNQEASAGLFLLLCAGLALIWANSPWLDAYESMLHFPVGIQWGEMFFGFSLHHWVNDALMAIFFFVVGLEIKRELSIGELSTPKKAAFPIFAALGGMVVPALCYLIFNGGNNLTYIGWGIPMATDIAFAVGILSLLSKRVPASLKIFLLALAIVDDLGAVLVIAFFYSQEIMGQFLAYAGLTVFIVFCVRKVGLQNRFIYLFLGICLWLFVLKSGVHATVAGVIMGFMFPARRTPNKEQILTNIREQLQQQKEIGLSYKSTKRIIASTHSLHSPTQHLIETLHPYVTWLIMPVFAFFNAGIQFKSGFSLAEFFSHPVSLGVMLGLFVGKPLGIVLFSFLALRLKLALWPSGFSWSRLTGIGFLAGIGFTMALFISHLSFGSQPELNVYSKLGILVASLLAMLIGLLFLFFSTRSLPESDNSSVNQQK